MDSSLKDNECEAREIRSKEKKHDSDVQQCQRCVEQRVGE